MKAGTLIFAIATAALLIAANIAISSVSASFHASGPAPAMLQTPSEGMHIGDNCLGCHSDPQITGFFANGETVSLYIDPITHSDPNHPECTDCHENSVGYPHAESSRESCKACHPNIYGSPEGSLPMLFEMPFPDQRSLTLALNENCYACHEEQVALGKESTHQRAAQLGNRLAPVCADCHGAHGIPSPTEPRTNTPAICKQCHLSVYTTYEASVHGAALTAEANPDVPSCANCHGSHEVEGPTTVGFRADTIGICGECHADPEMMDRYGISTNVFETYLDDFHGRSIDYARLLGQDRDDTQATCYDCHGIHNIHQPDHPTSTVYPDNLQATCARCHPDAGITFPQSWLSHYVPTLEKTPALFLVNLFYQVLIPSVIGGFVVYIALDARRRIASLITRRRHPHRSEGHPHG